MRLFILAPECLADQQRSVLEKVGSELPAGARELMKRVEVEQTRKLRDDAGIEFSMRLTLGNANGEA